MKFKQTVPAFLLSAVLMMGIPAQAGEHAPPLLQKNQNQQVQCFRHSFPEKTVFPFQQYKIVSQYGFSDSGFRPYTTFDVHGYVYAPFDGNLSSDEHDVTLQAGDVKLVFENAEPMLNDGPVQMGEKIAYADGTVKLHMFSRNMPVDFLFSFFPDKSELNLKKQMEEKAKSEFQTQFQMQLQAQQKKQKEEDKAQSGNAKNQRNTQPDNTGKADAQKSYAAVSLQRTLPKTEYDSIFDEAGKETNIDPLFLKTVAYVESGFNPKAVSPKGAVGIMQLMPQTAQMLGVKDVYNAEENIKAGAKYLRMMADAFNNNIDFTLAAYNAGPQAVKQYNGIPPYQETQNFVRTVKDLYASLNRK
ncbi:Transglycosylase SLT domain-containing protein [Caldanaerobius fijiensis DSM 17918]|uniref:Transglycosylase SLT domain-containing protein n=1 Tax=Caldanaerobius fijiensis DSM 17918 TaxID=1121256 RepID=A0A1M5BKD1_9THEO|nr:lytic transglycosylase domain-containing protein [Caldanaerobius fijiensis]SHF42707.1 Transglycosylase SLT domain-containing protein [Caldanaerobius fijiensis DSM 17918]